MRTCKICNKKKDKKHFTKTQLYGTKKYYRSTCKRCYATERRESQEFLKTQQFNRLVFSIPVTTFREGALI